MYSKSSLRVGGIDGIWIYDGYNSPFLVGSDEKYHIEKIGHKVEKGIIRNVYPYIRHQTSRDCSS